MNRLVYIPIAAILFAACNDNSKQQVQQLQATSTRDSLLASQVQQKDSVIVSYVKTLDEIQNNIDSIKAKEKILSVAGNEPPHGIISDIKSLDARIVWENRKIYQLEKRLKKDGQTDMDLQKVIKHLTKELVEKDAQIADLQTKLAESNASLRSLTEQFNDSLVVLHKQRDEINAMRTEVNSIYYAIGTRKELKKHNVITKEGSIIGIGGATELKRDFNNSFFIPGDMTKLHDIPLYSKLSKIITNHPSTSYKITGSNKSDTLHISDPASFWSESKYLVIMVK
jgi:hypothetical protein